MGQHNCVRLDLHLGHAYSRDATAAQLQCLTVEVRPKVTGKVFLSMQVIHFFEQQQLSYWKNCSNNKTASTSGVKSVFRR